MPPEAEERLRFLYAQGPVFKYSLHDSQFSLCRFFLSHDFKELFALDSEGNFDAFVFFLSMPKGPNQEAHKEK